MVETNRWASFDLIFFDCDSTLSTIEGIDELARFKGKEWRVSVLTQKAMDGELDLSEVYGKRLQAIRPTRGQLKEIEEQYWENLVPNAHEVIRALHFIRKQVFIISGGLAEPVRGFGKRLGVPAANIRAVELEYNELSGSWWHYYSPDLREQQTYLDYDDGPLTVSSGKLQIVRELIQGKHGRKIMIGDGASDLAPRPLVDMVVGFGGVVARKKVREEADIFITVNDLAPMLPIATGLSGYARVIGTEHQAVFDWGIRLALDTENVTFKDAEHQKVFYHAFEPLLTAK